MTLSSKPHCSTSIPECDRYLSQFLSICVLNLDAFALINALMSWGYGVLLARVFSACLQAGLDPYLGFFHATEPYRPNLVLDLMEEFRPVIVDQVVISIIQSNVLAPEDFHSSPDGVGVWVGDVAKKLFLAELEKQFRNTVLYPSQNRHLSLSQIILEQARSLGRCLTELTLDYEAFVIK
jgi:CRISPR-associated protein Cas1